MSDSGMTGASALKLLVVQDYDSCSSMKKNFIFIAIHLVGSLTAQCPFFVNCPTATQLTCAYTDNNVWFWNAATHTWNPSLLLADLPEADTDVEIEVIDSCGGLNLAIEYLLFLDLDGNGTMETVVQSQASLLAGKVLYNNVLSPNYAFGDTIEFDRRPGLPDSMKYRFALELTHSTDRVLAKMRWGRGVEQIHYSPAKLPLGKHRIVWHIKQGGVEQFCEYEIEVKDCAPPTVNCMPPFTMNVMPNGYATVWASDLLLSTSDNITPTDQLMIALRASGQSGTGFPVDSNGAPITSFKFDCLNIGVKNIELWVRDIAGNLDSCNVQITIGNLFGNCEVGIKLKVCAKISASNEGVEDVRLQVEGNHPNTTTFSTAGYSYLNGCAMISTVPPYSNFVITPSKNDNLLNGVTTYDLVLISKHILGSDPLDTPYKMVAADANKSGSITTFDIVELRKLILGIYTTLPENTSWRFVPKSFVFPNPQNPFQTAFPSTIEVQNWPGYNSPYEFIGIKVGDVNNTAAGNAYSSEGRAPNFLVIPDRMIRTDETVEVPIQLTEAAMWSGLQFSLDFDPDRIELVSLESSVLPDFEEENWAQPQVGQLTLSWSSGVPVKVAQRDNLLWLRVKALEDVQLSRAFHSFAKPKLVPEAYDSEGVSQLLQIVFSGKPDTEMAQVFAPQPNPTTGSAVLPVQISDAQQLRLEVYDLNGKLLWANEVNVEKGSHLLEIPAAVTPKVGLYVWRVQAGDFVQTGKLSKI